MRCKCGSTSFHKISTATVRQEIEQYHDGRSTRFRVSEIDLEDEHDVKLYCSVCGEGYGLRDLAEGLLGWESAADCAFLGPDDCDKLLNIVDKIRERLLQRRLGAEKLK